MKFEKIIFLIALLWYAITAYYSIGYIHTDEHYQIIEFAGLLDGTNQTSDLAWEFDRQIRSTTQPVIAHLVFKACEFISIDNPYTKVFVLRLLTALLAVISILFFTTSAKKFIEQKYWKVFLILSYFIWFLPFINVRFSSETWSGLALLIGVSLLIRGKLTYKTFVLVGLVLGFSFLLRYQIAIAVFGLVLWLLFIAKEKISNLAWMISAGFFVIFLGFLVDSWFYGESVFVFWNYLKTFFLSPASFGVHPWYYYFQLIGYYALPPIGLAILIAFVFAIYKKPMSVFVWISIPFLLTHLIIGHKELRFLYPIINFLPIIFILAIQSFNWKLLSNVVRKSVQLSVVFLVVLNLVCLLYASTIPAGISSRVKISKKIYQLGIDKPMNLYTYNNSNPFYPSGLSTNYYFRNNLNSKELNFSRSTEIQNNNKNILVIELSDIENRDIQEFIFNNNLKEICKSSPEFLIPILQNTQVLVLYSD